MNQKELLNLSTITRSVFTIKRTGYLSPLFFEHCDMSTTREQFRNLYFKYVKEESEFNIIMNEYLDKAEKAGFDRKEATWHANKLLFEKALNGFKKELIVMEELGAVKVQELERNSIDLYLEELDLYIQVKAYNYYVFRNHPNNIKMFEKEKDKQLKGGFSKVAYVYVKDDFEIAELKDYNQIKYLLKEKKGY